jgi:hypothetical protein
VNSIEPIAQKDPLMSRKATLLRRLSLRAGAVIVAVVGATGFSGVAQAASPVQPFVSCYWANGDGTYTVAVGYTNTSASTVTYPIGPLNFVTPAPQDRGQPTVFLPGTHNNVWAPTITQADLASGADWTLNDVRVSTGITSISACPTKPVPISGGVGGVIAFVAVALLIGAIGFKNRVRYQSLRARLRLNRS